MRKLYLMPIMLIFCLLLVPSQSHAINLMESFFLKITVHESDIEYQWEYSSPDAYEYEKGEKVIKTEEAKREMLTIVKQLELSKDAKVEEMVEKLKQARFPQLERLDIRWMTGDNKLYTWVWDKEN